MDMNLNPARLVKLMAYKYMWNNLKAHFEQHKQEGRGVGEIYTEFFKNETFNRL